MTRFWVVQTYLPLLGPVSEIIDSQGTRKILIAGRNHAERAKARAADLNAATAAKPRAASGR